MNALENALRGLGRSRPSSKRIMKSAHASGRFFRLATSGATSSAVTPYASKISTTSLLLDVRQLLDLARLPRALRVVVLDLAARGEIPAQAHGDGAGGDLGEPRGDDQVRRRHGAREARRQRERDGETVGHPEDDVAKDVATSEMRLDMRVGAHGPPNVATFPVERSRSSARPLARGTRA